MLYDPGVSINRRWDPCVWNVGSTWFRLNLAADYSDTQNKNPWWMRSNYMELWSGNDLHQIELQSVFPCPGEIWTAPTVCEVERGRFVCLTGLMRDGRPPGQRLLMLDPYTMTEVGEVPKPPGQYAKGDRVTWRDASLKRDGSEWILLATTGGFRHCLYPNVLVYRSDRWDSGWWPAGPIVDPALCAHFSELERPQLFRLQGKQWLLVFSCWPDRQYISAKAPPLHCFISSGDDFPLDGYLGALGGNYGTIFFPWDDGTVISGWMWTDRQSWTSACQSEWIPETIDGVISRLVAARNTPFV